jgi:hypothetical protein
MATRAAMMATMLSAAACVHSGQPVAKPTTALIEKLAEQEYATGQTNGYLIDQAQIFDGSPAPTFAVRNLACAAVAEASFRCTYTLVVARGETRTRAPEVRRVWKERSGGWTTDAIEALCKRQTEALHQGDCKGIYDR